MNSRALLFYCLLALQPALAADLFLVTGTVTNGLTLSPVPNAQVFIYRSGTSRPSNPYITGPDGRFSFNLPAGTYALHAGVRGTTENYGSHNDESPLGSAVIVGPGKDSTGLLFRFYPSASISGKVLDNEGEPVENAIIQLIRSTVAAGRRVTSAFRSVRTNDLGEYRFGWIPGGRYLITVTGQPWWEARKGFVDPSEASKPLQAFAPVYYPNSSDPSHAAPLILAPGEEVRADFTLRTAIGARITVNCAIPPGSKGLVSLIYNGIAGNDAFQQQETLSPQSILSGVPPGSYTLRVIATTATEELVAIKHIEVSGSDLSIDLVPHPQASVTGKLLFQDAATKPSGSVVVSLTKAGGSVYTAAVKPDGVFQFPNLLGASYQIGIRNAIGFFLRRVEVRGIVMPDGMINVIDGDSTSLTIDVSDQAGNLSGFVKSEGKACVGVLVVLVPAGATAPDNRSRAFQTESDGSFDLRTVPAGDYLIFAIEDTTVEYANPQALKPWLGSAKPVRVEAHKDSKEDVALSPALK